MAEEERSNILLVEDQPESLLALEAVLEPLGQKLVRARSGQEALWRLLNEDFALILLDIMLPDIDGFEVANFIRRRERSRHVPIIFMTAALKTEENAFKAYEAGAVDYILKPIIPEILRSKVAVFVELERKNRTIHRQAEMLRDADRARHEKQMADAQAFTHAVSHDLRAPLRHIESFAEILQRGYNARLDERGRDLLDRLGKAARKMSALIEGMSKLSKSTHSDLRREAVSLSQIASELGAELRAAEPGRNVELSVQEGLCAMGDPELLRVALENLMKNAWKYTAHRQEPAHIQVGRTERDGEAAYFVKDDGVGFDMKGAGRLFSPFARLHSPGEFAGTGLGLATTQRIIARHGGRIWAESHAGAGATFYFTLPGASNGRR